MVNLFHFDENIIYINKINKTNCVLKSEERIYFLKGFKSTYFMPTVTHFIKEKVFAVRLLCQLVKFQL